MPKAYSYARWSRPQQGRGDTLRRQLELSRRYAADHGLELDETFQDAGRSAYRGQNHTEGALASFIAQIDAGTVAAGSYLLVESLDRLSREKVLSALELFMGIIRRGVKIVTLTNGYEFDSDSLNANPALLMVSIVEMMRAHEESRMKGERVATANENKRRRARENKTPITAMCPAWLRLVRNGYGYDRARYEIIPERAAVVRRIYLEAIAGFGKRRIAKRLNDDKIPAFRGRDGWHESSVGKILENEAVLGLFQPHRKVDGKRVSDGLPPVSNYFPPVFDETEEWIFWQAQEAIRGRRTGAAGRKGDQQSNLFSGIGVCDECDGNLRYIDKGPKPKGGQYLTCQRALRRLCSNHIHYPYEPFEERMLHQLDGVIGINILAPEEAPKLNTSRVTELEGQLARRRDAQKRFIDNFKDADDPILANSILTLTAEIKQIETELREARRAAKIHEHSDRRDIIERVLEARAQLESNDPKQREMARTKLAQHFRQAIHSMKLREDRHMIVQSVRNESDVIDEYDLGPNGELLMITALWPDGNKMRFDAAVFEAVFPSFEVGMAERTKELFLNRCERPGMNQDAFLDVVLQRQQMVERLTLRQIGEKEYEVVLRDEQS